MARLTGRPDHVSMVKTAFPPTNPEGGPMETIDVRYRFNLGDGALEVFDLKFRPDDMELLEPVPETAPPWAGLEFHQCSHCPLTPADGPDCPLALCLVDVIRRFDRIISYDTIRLDVRPGPVFQVEGRPRPRHRIAGPDRPLPIGLPHQCLGGGTGAPGHQGRLRGQRPGDPRSLRPGFARERGRGFEKTAGNLQRLP